MRGRLRRQVSTLRQHLFGKGGEAGSFEDLLFRDVGSLLVASLDVPGIRREYERIRRLCPGLKMLTIDPSALALFLVRPLPPEGVRLLIEGSRWPEVLFFEVPSTPPPCGGQGQGAYPVHIGTRRRSGYVWFDFFACSYGDYSIIGFEGDEPYEAFDFVCEESMSANNPTTPTEKTGKN